jgi:C4-dicarboxylate-specific signal transduction histidine kinase
MRDDGQPFLARVWASRGSSEQAGMAMIFADASDELRELERSGIESLMASSELVLRTFLHEVRNLSTAIQATVVALSRKADLDSTPERYALDALISTLRQLANSPSPSRNTPTGPVDLASLLMELSIVLEPDLTDAGISLSMDLGGKPHVAAERHGLMQAFLNIGYNAITALKGTKDPSIDISVFYEVSRTVVRFVNNGPVPEEPAILFEAFRSGTGRSGLGLYVSQSIVKSYGGQLRYEPHPNGCCFAAELLNIAGNDHATI